VDYVKVNRTTDLAVTPSTSILFNQTETGNIPYDSANGQFTLKAGKTYLLNATAALTAGDNAFDFQWRTTTGTLLGSAATANGYANSNIPAVAVLTPSEDTVVTVYITAEGNSATMRGGYVQATIQQIGSTASTGVALNSLIAATASGALDNQNYGQTWAWSTADNETALTLTANALTTGTGLAITSSYASGNSTNGLLYVANTSAVTNGVIARIQSNSTAGSGLTVLANGMIGMGTTTPAVNLDVYGAAGPSLYVHGDASGFKFTNDLGINYIESVGANMTGAAELRFTDMNAANTWMTIGSTGNIGIGTSTPGVKLEIQDGGSHMEFGDDGTNSGISVIQTKWGTTPGTSKLILNPEGGSVGIGTTTPTNGLSIQSDSSYGMVHLISSAANGESSIQFKSADDTNDTSWIIGKNTSLTGDQLSFWHGSNKLVIDAAGQVGIGTDTPTAALTFAAGSTVNSLGALTVAATNGDLTMSSSQHIYINPAASYGNTYIGTSAANGDIYIGNTTSGASVNILAGNTGSGNISLDGGTFMVLSVDNYVSMLAEKSSSSSGNDEGNYVARIFNSSTGAYASGLLMNLGPASPGNNNQWIEFMANGVEKGAIEGNGGNVSYYSTSDQRLKTDIADTVLSLDDLMKIHVRDFTWESNGIRTNGFIAQELYPIYKDAVSKGDDGKTVKSTWMVDYGRLTPLIVKSIQEQQAEIEANVDSIVALDLRTKNIVEIEDGKTVFKGTVVADTLKANKIEGLDFATGAELSEVDAELVKNGKTLNDISEQLALLEAKITGKELSLKLADLEVSGGVTFKSNVEFQGPAVFKKIAEFIDKVVFKKDVEFAGNVTIDKNVTFNSNSAGYAIIKKNDEGVSVTFEQAYPEAPIVTATPQSYVSAEYKIKNVTAKGFEILINEKTDDDITFAWTAMLVKGAKTTSSNGSSNGSGEQSNANVNSNNNTNAADPGTAVNQNANISGATSPINANQNDNSAPAQNSNTNSDNSSTNNNLNSNTNSSEGI